VLAALAAVSAGHDPGPALDAYLAELRATWGLDEAGLLVLGPDGQARVRAWQGPLAPVAEQLDALWLDDDAVPSEALAILQIRRSALWPAGPQALLLLGRHDEGPLPPPIGDPLVSAVLLAEEARATRKTLGVAAAVCAATDERGVWRAVDAALPSRFGRGALREIEVAGSGQVIEASAETAADCGALAAIAGLVAVALRRGA
jgi:hypothetical protein